MQPNHPQNGAQTAVNWLEIAKRKYYAATVHGSGRWCVIVFDHINIYLFPDRSDAEQFCMGHPPYKIVDLAQEPTPVCRTIPDAHDADELRRERREKRQVQR